MTKNSNNLCEEELILIKFIHRLKSLFKTITWKKVIILSSEITSLEGTEWKLNGVKHHERNSSRFGFLNEKSAAVTVSWDIQSQQLHSPKGSKVTPIRVIPINSHEHDAHSYFVLCFTDFFMVLASALYFKRSFYWIRVVKPQCTMLSANMNEEWASCHKVTRGMDHDWYQKRKNQFD